MLLALTILVSQVAFSISAYAQFGSFTAFHIQGKVFVKDSFHDKPYPKEGINLNFVCVSDTTTSEITRTDKEGKFSCDFSTLNNLKTNDLKITASYVGMEPWSTIVSTKDTVDNIFGVSRNAQWAILNNIILESKPVTLEETVIMGELTKMFQRGDTAVFNVDAYEMPKGSVLLELIRRLPGLHYSDNKLTYMGRDVEEMRLNGDTFFKNDISIALKNMPNAELKTLEVYETARDTTNALAGKKLVMDMKTKRDITSVTFSNASGGITPDKDLDYQLSADGNIYKKGGEQISIMGNMENIPNTTIVEKSYNTKSGSISYNQNFAKVNIDANYRYDYIKREDETDRTTKYLMPENTQTTHSIGTNRSKERGHEVSGNIVYDLSKSSDLNMHYEFSQKHQLTSFANRDTVFTNNVVANNSLSGNSTHTDNTQFNFKPEWTLKTGANGRFGINANVDINRENSDGLEFLNTSVGGKESQELSYDRGLRNPERTYKVEAGPIYQQTFGKYLHTEFGYQFSYNYNNNRREYSDIDNGLISIDSLGYKRKTHIYGHRIGAKANYLRG